VVKAATEEHGGSLGSLEAVLDPRPPLAFSWFTGFWAAAELEMPGIG